MGQPGLKRLAPAETHETLETPERDTEVRRKELSLPSSEREVGRWALWRKYQKVNFPTLLS